MRERNRPMPNVLFLDAATQFGFCIGKIGEAPVYGSVGLASENAPNHAKFADAQLWLENVIATNRPNLIAIERPAGGQFKGATNAKSTAFLQSLADILATSAYRAKIFDIRLIAVQSIRKELLGRPAMAGKGKIEVMTKLVELGYRPQDDNASDAIAGWLYTCKAYAPDSIPFHMSPLFRNQLF